MSFPIESFQAALSKIVPGAIGALLSLQFLPPGRKWYNTFWSIVSGCSVSYYIGGATIDYFHVVSGGLIAPAIYFCLGLFGLSLITNAMNEVKPALDGLRKRIFGPASGE